MAVRILILTSEYLPLMGGIGTYAREMAAAATELGAEVTVLAPDYGGNFDDRASPFKVIRFAGGRHRARELPSKIRLVRKLLAERQYDIVHAADWPFFIPLRLAPRRPGEQRLIMLHGTEINELAGSYKRLLVRWLGLFDGWAKIVTNSEFTRRLLFEQFGVRAKDNVDAEPLGASAFWRQAARPAEATRAELGISADRLVLLTVGRLTERKGQLTVVAALRRLPPDVARQCCYLVVGPDYDAEFTQRLRKAGAGLDLRIIGEAPDELVRDLYAASDLFCLVGAPDRSGRVEGFGLVLLEAGAQGLPALASATGGVPEVVRDGISGVLVPPCDAASTGAAIMALAQKPEWRRQLGVGAHILASELTWRRCASSTYGLRGRRDASSIGFAGVTTT
ncbi:phosphatidylinositol alpha-1,6-mannosyltransferase [Bradyrhizobium sp. USDA 4449]